MTLNVKRITTTSILPTRATQGSVGYDLYADEDAVVRAGGRGVISTGISVEVPQGTYGRIAPRSGLAVKNGIQVGAGVVDQDYTGELKVVLFNHGDKGAEGAKVAAEGAKVAAEAKAAEEAKAAAEAKAAEEAKVAAEKKAAEKKAAKKKAAAAKKAAVGAE